MMIYGWLLVGSQVVMTVVIVILYLRLRSQVHSLVEDIHYYRWFVHALTLLTQQKTLTSPMRQAIDAETKIAEKIVGG